MDYVYIGILIFAPIWLTLQFSWLVPKIREVFDTDGFDLNSDPFSAWFHLWRVVFGETYDDMSDFTFGNFRSVVVSWFVWSLITGIACCAGVLVWPLVPIFVVFSLIYLFAFYIPKKIKETKSNRTIMVTPKNIPIDDLTNKNDDTHKKKKFKIRKINL